MNQAFEITQQNRKILHIYLQKYSLEQLNKIPEGFSNNLIWNIGHIIVVQQLLVYKLSGLQPMVSATLISKYARGTRPEGDVSQAEVDEIESLLFKTIEQTKTDLENNVFKNYHEFKNELGFTIKSAEEAIAFNYFHEATHLGIMMSIKKFV
ncbi:DinB family protein [Flavobacterium qiangtangense]|uniref:DinB family protein n=1 Tax=Flavobacterium qiangtangense TaxID=1442595 RepID=A0ABW1PTL3_9FLAO